jgi:hypothetical protein
MSNRNVGPIVTSPIVEGRAQEETDRGWRDKSADVCRAHVVGGVGILAHGANCADGASFKKANVINVKTASMRTAIGLTPS